MSIQIFWLLGLLTIGVVTALFARSVKVTTTKDQDTIGKTIGWGCALATLWIIYGGIIVTVAYLGSKN